VKRTTVKVPDDLDARMRQEAERRGVTVSELTREALQAYLEHPRGGRLSFIASGRSRERDVSTRVEEILREEWGRRGPR